MPLRTRPSLRVESLESRAVPATLVDAQTVTFHDADGDVVTVTLSQTVLTDANKDAVFHFDTGTVDGSTSPQQLQQLDLTGLPAGLSVTMTATGGDGKADVGAIV